MLSKHPNLTNSSLLDWCGAIPNASSKGTDRLTLQPLGHRPTFRFQWMVPTTVSIWRVRQPFDCIERPHSSHLGHSTARFERRVSSASIMLLASHRPICSDTHTIAGKLSAPRKLWHCSNHSWSRGQICSIDVTIMSLFFWRGQGYYRCLFYFCPLTHVTLLE